MVSVSLLGFDKPQGRIRVISDTHLWSLHPLCPSLSPQPSLSLVCGHGIHVLTWGLPQEKTLPSRCLRSESKEIVRRDLWEFEPMAEGLRMWGMTSQPGSGCGILGGSVGNVGGEATGTSSLLLQVCHHCPLSLPFFA